MYSLNWPHVYGAPTARATFKSTPDDFHVNELFKGSFSGAGEHILLNIEKRGLTTGDLIKSLARLINKPIKMISYAGLKDRQALTTQWISIHAPGEVIEGIGELKSAGWCVLEHTRHHKKLRPGFLTGNQFMVRLRDVSDMANLLERIELVKTFGVPNYFGEQRFGREGGNLIKAEAMLVQNRKVKDRFLKGIYFSAARSWLFNLILSKRVQQKTWNIPIAGDVMHLSGTRSVFTIDAVDDTLFQRINEKDISPASPLPGKGLAMAKGDAQQLISETYNAWKPWIEGLEKHGVEEAWRANILSVEALEYSIRDDTIELTFTLPAGSYATTVLRELVTYVSL